MLNCKLRWRSKVQLLHIHSPSPSETSPIDTYPSRIPNANAYLYAHKAYPILQQARLFTTHRYAVKIQVASNFPYCKFISRSYYYTLCTCRITRHFTAEDFYLQLFLSLHIAVLAALCNPQPNLSPGTWYLSVEAWGWHVLAWGHRQETHLKRYKEARVGVWVCVKAANSAGSSEELGRWVTGPRALQCQEHS